MIFMKYNKLIRDKIPEIIKERGETVVTHIASDDEYLKKLCEKLQEEVKEYLEDNNTDELADILEVVHALCKTHNIDTEQLEVIRKKKAEKQGSFNDKIILDEWSVQ